MKPDGDTDAPGALGDEDSAIEPDDWQRVATFWREQNERPRHRPLAMIEDLFNDLCGLINADDAFAVIAARTHDNPKCSPDPLDGWRVVEAIIYRSNEKGRAIARRWSKTYEAYASDIPTRELTRRAGAHRACLLGDLLGETPWGEHTAYEQIMSELGVHDRLVGAHTVSPARELYIGLDRMEGTPRFSARERDMLLVIMEGLGFVARRLLSTFGWMPDQEPLTPRERDMLHHLLDGLSEKEAAAEMGITAASGHQYVVSIYRKLGVNSRAQLLGLWFDPPRS